MTISDRIYLYNQWFDRLPQQQQFLAAFWSALGGLGVMLMLTWFAGIPFLLMVMLFLLVVMGPRVMFKFDLIDHAPELPARDVGGETHIAVRRRPGSIGRTAGSTPSPTICGSLRSRRRRSASSWST